MKCRKTKNSESQFFSLAHSFLKAQKYKERVCKLLHFNMSNMCVRIWNVTKTD